MDNQILNRISKLFKSNNASSKESDNFKMQVYIGDKIKPGIKNFDKLKKRDCITKLQNYIEEPVENKICILYGLRSTGKKVMMHQVIKDMSQDIKNKTAFIDAEKENTLSDLKHDIHLLEKMGITNVFIDEVTKISDFIDTASIFSDSFSKKGMRFVLSGTDSLSFMFAMGSELYDRAVPVHTTEIPFHEFGRLASIEDVNDYICCGGTLNFKEQIAKYEKTAIAENIQNSLQNFNGSRKYAFLQDLYYKYQLTDAIQRVVHDQNHEFLASAINYELTLEEWKIFSKNISKENIEKWNHFIDEVEDDGLKQYFMKKLNIIDYFDVQVTEETAQQLKVYMKNLNLLKTYKCNYNTDIQMYEERNIITQPGLRYAQIEVLLECLNREEPFIYLLPDDKMYVKNRIVNAIKGQILKDIVMHETKTFIDRLDADRYFSQCITFHKNKDFHIESDGEIDLVITDSRNRCCDLYEIKLSDYDKDSYYQHLINKNYENKIKEYTGYDIRHKVLLYRGDEAVKDNGCICLNAGQYLRLLPQGFDKVIEHINSMTAILNIK